ncbi:ATP-binding protein [Vreelandella rituensis]|uniref:ATP-binding protein n=1 Tax=Vreelandella rituensis TaxID=2282306 RepID=A0A368TMG3_9GAMM|nr:ATP-binding protein [Halomonas rituensis]RCV85774.1 ATP-binding protein [Halomonas rituensis]
MKGTANETLFHPDLEPFYAAGESAAHLLKRELPRLGITVSNQIENVVDYRSIIQNNADGSGRRRRSGSPAFSLAQEARDFSLGDGVSSMRHMEALTSVALRKTGLLASLKSMIVDTMLRDRIAIAEPPAHHKNKDLWQDVLSLRAFNKEIPAIREGIAKSVILQEVRADLNNHRHALASRISSEIAVVREKEIEVVALKEAMSSLEEKHTEDRDQLASRAATRKGEAEAAQRWLDHLKEQRASWDDKGIDTLRRDIEGIPDLERSWRTANGLYNQIRKTAEKLIEDHHQQRGAMQDSYTEKEEKLRARADTVQQAITAMSTAHIEANRAIEKRFRQELETLKRESDAAATTLRDEEERRMAARDHAGQMTDEEQRQLDNATAEVDRAEAGGKRLDKALEAAKEAYREAANAYQQALDALSSAERAEGARQHNVDTLTRQCYPADGTLLAFLRTSDLAWHDTLGKLLPSELYQRRDLNPMLSASPHMDQVYGLTFDLSALPLPAIAESEAILEAKLQKAEEALTHAKTDVRHANEALKKANVARKKAEEAGSQARVRAEQASSKYDNAVAGRRHLEGQLLSNRQARIASAKAQLDTARKAIAEHEKEWQAQQQERQQQHDTQRQQLSADQQTEQARLTADLGVIQQVIADTRNEKKQRLAEMDALLAQAMSKEGIDPSAIAAKKAEVDSLRLKINSLREQEPTLHEYASWEKVEWSRKPEYEKQRLDAQHALEKLRNELRQAEQHFKTQRAEKRVSLKAISQAIDAKQQGLSDWRQRIDNADKVLADIPDSQIGVDQDNTPPSQDFDSETTRSTEQIASELSRLLTSANSQRQEVMKAVQGCQKRLSQHPGTHIHNAWQALLDQRRAKSTHEELSSAFTIEQVDDLETLIEHHLPDISGALIEGVKASGGTLYTYHENLQEMNNIVSQVSRTLEKNLNTQHTFTVISDISVRVQSKIQSFGFWKDLSSFAQSWREWASNGYHGMPSDGLMQQIHRTDDQMQVARMQKYNIESMVDLEIEFYEQRRRVPIRSDKDLTDAASQGITRLAILTLFNALTRYLCPERGINITWPIDELGDLSPENIVKLFQMMKDNNIALLCAQPEVNRFVVEHFQHKVHLSKLVGVRIMVPGDQQHRVNPLLAQAPSPSTSRVDNATAPSPTTEGANHVL